MKVLHLKLAIGFASVDVRKIVMEVAVRVVMEIAGVLALLRAQEGARKFVKMDVVNNVLLIAQEIVDIGVQVAKGLVQEDALEIVWGVVAEDVRIIVASVSMDVLILAVRGAIIVASLLLPLVKYFP